MNHSTVSKSGFSGLLKEVSAVLNNTRLYLMDKGLLTLLLGVRFFALLIIFLRYTLLNTSASTLPPSFSVLYLLYLIGLTALRFRNQRMFESNISKFGQALADIIFFTIVYLERNYLESASYLLYMIPLLLAVRYLPTVVNIIFVSMVIGVMFSLSEIFDYGRPPNLEEHFQWSVPARCAVIAAFLGLRFLFSDYFQLIDDLKGLAETGRAKWGKSSPFDRLLQDFTNNVHPDRARELIEQINVRLRLAKTREALLNEAVVLAHKELRCETAAIFLVENGKAQRKKVMGILETALSEENYGPGEGLTGKVLVWSQEEQRLLGSTALNNEAGSSPLINGKYLSHYQQILRSGEVRHLLAVPITGSHATFGILRVVNKVDNNDPITLNQLGFTSGDISILSIIASLVGNALEQEANLRRLERLSDISIKLVSLFEEEKIYRYIMEQTVQLLEVKECSIFVTNPATQVLQLRVSNLVDPASDYAKLERPISNAPGASLVSFVAYNKQPLVFKGDEYLRHPAFSGYTPQMLFGIDFYSVMFVPLLDFENKCVGVMRLSNKQGPEGKATFSDEDLKTAQILASELANAIRREFLFNEKQEQKEKQVQLQTTLRKLAQNVVSHVMSPGVALQRVADASALLLKADLVCIYPYFHGSHSFRTRWLTYSNHDRLTTCEVTQPRPKGNTQRVNDSPVGYTIVNFQEEPELQTEFIRQEEITCLLGVRLDAKNENLGVLYVYHREPHLFTEEEINLARIIANLTALILLNAESEINRNLASNILTQMQEVRRLAIKERSLHGVLDKILAIVQDIYNFEFVAVWLEESAERLWLRSAPENLEFSPNYIRFVVPLKGMDRRNLGYLEAGYPGDNKTDSDLAYQLQLGLEIVGEQVGLLLEEFNIIQALEEQTRRRKEQDQVLENQSEYLSHFSHELRAPVVRAKENLDNVLKGRVTEPEDQMKRIGIAHQNLSDELDLINRLLRLMRQEVKGPKYQPVDLVDIVDEVLADHREWARDKGIQLICTSNTELPELMVDPEFIKDALNHLVSNALSFTLPGQKVTISYCFDGSKTYIRVQDTGPGIAADKFELIFEKFYQGDEPFQREHKGVGLGLYFARKFARMHQGDILVESRQGEGSCFTLQLPLQRLEAGDEITAEKTFNSC